MDAMGWFDDYNKINLFSLPNGFQFFHRSNISEITLHKIITIYHLDKIHSTFTIINNEIKYK